MTDDLGKRLAAVERALTDGESDSEGLADAASFDRRLSNLEATATELSTRVDELDAAVQAVRGFVGGVRAVDADVERRANAALAKAESLEATLAGTPVLDDVADEVSSTDFTDTQTPDCEETPTDDDRPTVDDADTITDTPHGVDSTDAVSDHDHPLSML
ncbi:MAG: DUF7310 family coiled-coil domain-containing protein, partial [Halobacteriota archaeon]